MRHRPERHANKLTLARRLGTASADRLTRRLALAPSPARHDQQRSLWLCLLWLHSRTPGTIDKKEFSNLSENQDQASLAIQLAVFDMVDTSGDGLIQP